HFTQVKECDDNITPTNSGIAYWKFRGTRYATSEDFQCWKEKGELYIRECNTTTGKWYPETVVCNEQVETDRYCPEEYVELYDEDEHRLCVKISDKKQKYDEHFCNGAESIVPLDLSRKSIASFTKLISNRNIRQHWLPIRRERSTSPFQIRLPGKRWGQVVDEDKGINNLSSDHKCASAIYVFNATKSTPESKIQTTDCDAQLYSVCAFRSSFIANSGCPDGLGAITYRPGECYGIDWRQQKAGEAQEIHVKEYFQNQQIVREILSKVIPKDKRYDYFQVDKFQDKSGENFVILMNQREMIQVKKKDSKQLPFLYKEVVSTQANAFQMILKVDRALEELLLVVYNRQYLWYIYDKDFGIKCFTNADYEILRATKIDLVWENKDATKTIFKVKMVHDDPGEYWCEGHIVQGLKLVSTPKIVAAKEKRGHAFAIKVNTTCLIKDNQSLMNTCSRFYGSEKKLAKQIQNALRLESKQISRDLVIHNVRIMSIEGIAYNTIECWIHVTASLRNSAVDNSDEESSEEDDSSENEEHIRHDTSIRMKVWTMLKDLMAVHDFNSSNIVRSTEYCFPEQFHLENGDIYMWQQVEKGHLGTLSRICLQETGMPLTRQCIGDFIHGAYWKPLVENISCRARNDNTMLTTTLYNLERSKTPRKSPEKALKEIKSIFQEYSSKFLPVDINFAANILQASVKHLDELVLSLSTNISVTEQLRSSVMLKEAIPDLISIYNSLINVKESTIKMSSQLNSTNKLLEVFEIAMNTLSIQSVINRNSQSPHLNHGSSAELDSRADFEVLDFDDVGVSAKISPNLLYFIIDPSIANISGIAIFKNNNSIEQQNVLKGAFKDEYFRFLQSNHMIEDFIYEPELQFGTYVPENLLMNLNAIANTLNSTEIYKTIIVIKVYSNDKLFLPTNSSKPSTVLGRVVSISLPGYSSHLPEELPLIFRALPNSTFERNDRDLCKYWNFQSWASDGIKVANLSGTCEDIVLCQVSHLTPFAYLVGFNFSVDENIEVNIREIHDRALDIITLTGCSLSLLGLCGIFITAA
ncbi:hypothetical protein KR222_008392, partial [Zaprionus bogoriensis]